MMASSKTLLKDGSLSDRDFEGVILEGKEKPPAYRLKIGRIRVEYFVDGQMIVIFNIFMKKRKSDYR